MASDVIYTDGYGREVGFLQWCTGDFIIGKRNDFSLKVPVMDELVQDCYLMIDGTEYGGVIDDYKIDTSKEYMEVMGRTWHGIMAYDVIQPPPGQTHYAVSGEANAVMAQVIERQGLGFHLCASKDPSGFRLSNYRFDRYCTTYEGLRKMLNSVGAQLAIAYDGKERRAALSAVPREDHRGDAMDGDRAKFTISRTRPVNHIIALGAGEGTARLVAHVYADEHGRVSEVQTLFGVRHKAEVYDNNNLDDLAKLKEDAAKRLTDYQKDLYSCQMSGAERGEYGIDAVVAATYAPRNTTITAVIAQKQATLKRGEITYKTVCEPIGEE